MSDGPEGHDDLRRESEIEEALRAEVESAKTAYDTTKHYDRWVKTLLDDPVNSDGHHLVRTLIRRRSQATERLARALKEFADFVAEKKIPERFKRSG